MADYNISAEITADTSGFESGIKKAQKASKNLSKSVSGVIQGLGKSGLVGALGAVGLASAGVSAVLGTVAKVAKKVAQTVDECSQAYRKQYQAEIALSTAVNNNPYVDGTATKRLKEFASEMQRVSDIGDEELLPMMADLIAKGRTEDETMQMMSVALDMSAGGAMSLDTAITQLNATLNGNVGRLGQQNAELKGLTEEELKQGKAVEILGAKYKGLAQATADSQKQLRNAIGDLKENIGQVFEQALSPMRKFFTEVITNLNNSITKSRELKTAMKEAFGDNGEVNIGASTDALNTAFTEVLHKQQEVTKNYQQYIQLYGKYIDVTTDETALSYRTQIADLNAQLKAISEELDKRRKESEEEKKKLAQAKADEEAQRELEKQKEIREKELVVEKEWADKLFAIRIENLERQRDLELENEELTQEQRIAINEFYGNQILAMKIKQIEKERDEALNGENVTEEARVSINRYYEDRILKVKEEENEKKLKLIKKSNDDEIKEEEIKLAVIIKIAQEATKKMAENITRIAKNIVSTVKKVISTIGNIFTSLFEFNPDQALDNLLKFEDSVLTFFVETLPKLPSFFESAVQSIVVLISSILNVINFDTINGIIESIIKSLGNLVTSVAQYFNRNADKITKALSEGLKTIIQGLSNWISSGGWKEFLKALLNLQMMLEKVVTDNINEIVDTIIAMLPDLIDMLIKSIVSASRTLAKLIQPILKLVMKLIEALIEVAFSEEVLDASMEVIEAFIVALTDVVTEISIKMLPKLLTKIIAFVIKSLPKLVVAIVKGLIQAFAKTNWVQVVKDIFMGFIDAFKELFGIHSPSKLFEEFGTYMVQGLVNGLKGLTDAVNQILQPFYNFVTKVFGRLGDIVSNSISVSFKGLAVILDSIADGTAKITNAVANLVKALGELIEKAGKAVSALNPFSGGGSGEREWYKKIVDPFNIAWHANGTNNASKGLALVGEAGPELVRFNGGEQVLNTRNTQKALANAGGNTNNFNVTFNNLKDTSAFAMMNQLKQYNRQMAINGIV